MTALEIAQRFESDTAKYPDTAVRREINTRKLELLCLRQRVNLEVVRLLIAERARGRDDA